MRKIFLSVFPVLSCLAAWDGQAAESSADPEFDEILSQDISGLTVTSVSKHAQRLSDTAAAVYVITQEEIRRAGVYSIPEALRLVPGMQVAKLAGDQWAVSARGFNSALNNKLLVMIDGRPIYTPVFSGVYWSDKSTSINDIDRIEVVRGPGASLWGANAVNGVINIITKSAEDTQGNLLSATATSKGNGLYEARHGGKIGVDDYYRAYAQYTDASSWNRKRGGFRMDGKAADNDSYTFQGDAYTGEQDATLTLPTFTTPFSQSFKSTNDAYGGNLLGRWNHKIARDSDLSFQAYVDHYSRNELNAAQHVTTADMQAQHSFKFNDANYFVWGGGARLYYQNLVSTYAAGFNERFDTHTILNLFAQDEYTLVPRTLFLTVGSKLEYNDFTGVEIQPTARLAWHPTENQTVWGAVSRAVRTPSSVENDVSILAQVQGTVPPTELRIVGNLEQKSEELIAYELGHRIQFTPSVSFDTALFFNDYDRLQTIGLPGASFTGANGNTITPYMVNNLGAGHVYGLEIAPTWNVTPGWKLAGSYTFLKMDLDVQPGTATTLESSERLAPRHQFAVQSYYNISDTLHWDNMVYYVGPLSPPVDSYVRYDMRLAWMARPGMELSFIGRNLIDTHTEFPGSSQATIGRSYIGQILWKF